MSSLTGDQVPHCGDFITIAVMGARPSLFFRLSARRRGRRVTVTGAEEDRREMEYDTPEPVQAGSQAS